MSSHEIPYEYGSEERVTAKKLLDAAERCYNRNFSVPTDFLDLSEQEVLRTISCFLPQICSISFGGYDLAERKMILFVPDVDYPYERPYDVLRIEPADGRFSEKLTHRDYMGAIMGLSIARSKFGDILTDDGGAVVFCVNSVTDYICENLTQVRHTFVNIRRDYNVPADFEPSFKEVTGTVASVRLDSVISLGFGLSRNHAVPFIEGGKTTVNGRVITTNAYTINDGDIISVRSLGKIRFIHMASETKKGRFVVVIHKYQ